MTDEERDLTLEYLKEMQEKYIEGYGYEAHPLPEWYALDNAIKTLEQEDVFEKIKAEVEKLPITDTAVRLVTEILDKHKAESEG